AADGNEVIGVDGEHRVENPVVVSPAEQDLLARFHIEGVCRVVRTAVGDHLAVWRPGGSVAGVITNHQRAFQRLLFEVPNLHFAGWPGTIAAVPLSPPLSMPAKSVMAYSPPRFAG